MDAISIKFRNCSENKRKELIEFLWKNDFEVCDYRSVGDYLVITGYCTCEETFNELFGCNQPNNIYDFCKQTEIYFEHMDLARLGWLDLNGNFYPVINDEHQSWAYKYIKEHMDIHSFDEKQIDPTNAGDYLVNKGWVLLHSPGTENVIFEHNSLMKFTKAQQNFLHDYCINNKMAQRINDLYE